MSHQKRFRKIPLFFVMAIMFISLNLIAVATVGYFSFHNGQKAVNAVATQLRDEISNRIVDRLRAFADIPFHINQTNASLIRQGILPVDDQVALVHHFWNQVQQFDHVSSIYFGNIWGGLADAGREGAGDFLYEITTDNFVSGPFRKFATNSQGERTELLLHVPNFDARTRGWYIHALEAGGATWNAPYILFSGQDMAIAASQPAYDGNGNLVGVVSVDIFLSQLSNFLQSMKIGQTGQAFIVERPSGLLVATSTEAPLFTAPEGDAPRKRILAQESEDALIRRAMDAMMARRESLEAFAAPQQFAFDLNGARYYAQVTPFCDPRGLDWLVVVLVPEADFMAQIQANTRITFIWMAGTMAITAALTVLLTRRILNPIKTLATFSQTIQKGDWGKTIAHDSRIEEISLMTHAFNQMSRKVAGTITDLQREIQAHQEALQSLYTSETKLRRVIEQMDEGVSLTDEHGIVIVWNHRLEEITGLPAETMLGKPVWEVQFELLPAGEQTPGRRAQLEQSIRAFLATGHAPWAGKIQGREFTRADGGTIFVEGTTFPIQTEQGFMLGSLTRDITERKKAEEILRQNREQLEQRVHERTDELVQKNEDLRRFALLAAGRELRIKELREENETLRQHLRDAGLEP